MVGDLAVLHTHNVDRLEMDLVMGWSNAKKRPFVRAVVTLVRCHSVTNACLVLSSVRLRRMTVKSSAKSSSKTSNLPSPWTCSIFRRTTAFAASEELMLLIFLPLFLGEVFPCVHSEFRDRFHSGFGCSSPQRVNVHHASSSLSLLRQLWTLRHSVEQASVSILCLKLRYWIEFSGILFQR